MFIEIWSCLKYYIYFNTFIKYVRLNIYRGINFVFSSRLYVIIAWIFISLPIEGGCSSNILAKFPRLKNVRFLTRVSKYVFDPPTRKA